jgi:hypothetical protein
MEGAIEENTDRINIMEDHLKNVQQELVYTQSRVRVHKKPYFGVLLIFTSLTAQPHESLFRWTRRTRKSRQRTI